jgi:hypothetical protein
MELSLLWRRWQGAATPASRPVIREAQPQPAAQERRALGPDELERLGLGIAVRPYVDRSNEAVRRLYCLSCGVQIDSERKHEDPSWARCPQGCNESSAASRVD